MEAGIVEENGLSWTGTHYTVDVPPVCGEAYKAARYTLYVPRKAGRLRCLILHQHGCSVGAEVAGETASFDLQWQALANRWDAALLGSSYRMENECADWSDPERGTSRAFLAALEALARGTGHPEIGTVPWFFWGHSGGATWSWLTFHRYPERFAGLVLRSGPTVAPEPSTLAIGVPVLVNLGIREREHERYRRIWSLAHGIVRERADAGGPVSLAIDPQTEHECGRSRFLCIPFIDACLRARLPGAAHEDAPLRAIVVEKGWMGDLESLEVAPWREYRGERARATWLIDEPFAHCWQEYCRTAMVRSARAPERAPWGLAARTEGSAVRLSWQAEASWEGGIRTFHVYRDGARAEGAPRVFQEPNYHDTPDRPLAGMELLDLGLAPGSTHRYEVSLVDWSDRESPRSEPVVVRTRP